MLQGDNMLNWPFEPMVLIEFNLKQQGGLACDCGFSQQIYRWCERNQPPTDEWTISSHQLVRVFFTSPCSISVAADYRIPLRACGTWQSPKSIRQKLCWVPPIRHMISKVTAKSYLPSAFYWALGIAFDECYEGSAEKAPGTTNWRLQGFA